jgi:Ala-tRNA(Pro) deacylase
MTNPAPPAPPEAISATSDVAAVQARLCGLLTQLGISYQHFTHPAVFSTADVVLLPEKLPGVDTKNLFLRDEKRQRFVLVCVRAETRIDLKELGRLLQLKGITFGSPEELLQLLGVTPGAVCLFALLNDSAGRVTGYLDSSIEPAAPMQNHPLVNTATVVMPSCEVERFCAHVGHPLTRIQVPTR